jgi:hypothetical protein
MRSLMKKKVEGVALLDRGPYKNESSFKKKKKLFDTEASTSISVYQLHLHAPELFVFFLNQK